MPARLPIAIAVGLIVAVVTGCGSESSAPPEIGAGPNVGASIRVADCLDWNQATTEERLGTISQLRQFAGGPVLQGSEKGPAGTGSVLEDKDAYGLLTSYCGNQFAQGFKLYKLYQRAAAFRGKPQQ